MKTTYLLIKDGVNGIIEFLTKYQLFSVRLINLGIAYLISYIIIMILWYIYELIMLVDISPNKKDFNSIAYITLVPAMLVSDLFNKDFNNRYVMNG